MRSLAPWFLGAAFLLVPAALAGGGIHGTIHATDGSEYTGYIRWDKNENFWDDVLDAQKKREIAVQGGRREVKVFGLRISTRDDNRTIRSQFSVPFGHLAALEPRGGSRASIRLKSGEELDVLEGSSDIGDGVRGIVIDDKGAGEIELEWDDVDYIEFSQGPGSGRDSERLYGTVETRRARFTGYIIWDRDESLVSDILDGETDGRKYKVPFSKIDAIEQAGKRAAIVYLATGRELELRGSNDVNKENRGIDVTIPGVGVVTVEWDEFKSVVFDSPPPSSRYDEFDGGRKLYGTVRDDDDRTYTGVIVWDRDEEYTWEPLNGEALDVDFAIRFENIDRISRESRRSTRVDLVNGQSYVLAGSNDVNHDNKGILVTLADGSEVEIDWDQFVEVVFDR